MSPGFIFHMGYTTEEIGPLMSTSHEPVPISGVCAVFAESEVINHLSLGVAPCDIMQGAIESLVGRAVQLMKRVKGEPEFALIGGILRFETMAKAVTERSAPPMCSSTPAERVPPAAAEKDPGERRSHREEIPPATAT